MKELIIGKNEAGQRADKLLFKYLNAAPASFVYKMMRKKNIVLNGRKMTGQEILKEGDRICIWFSDETLGKFHRSGVEGVTVFGSEKGKNLTGEKEDNESAPGVSVGPPPWFQRAVIYEDAQMILVNKPANILSQRAEGAALSMNEYLIAYLLSEGKITEQQLDTFHPAFCNRLDRNTTGILMGGKTLAALQELSELFRTRRIKKYYLAIVCGGGMEDMDLCGYLHKDEKTNKVEIRTETADSRFGRPDNREPSAYDSDAAKTVWNAEKKPEKDNEDWQRAAGSLNCRNSNRRDMPSEGGKKWERIETSFQVMREFSLPCDAGSSRTFTLLKIHLITGKTHQIRAHLATIGHPIVGDAKYGRNKVRRKDAVAALSCFENGNEIQGQMLHSYELDFPEDLEGALAGLAGKQFFCEPPLFWNIRRT